METPIVLAKNLWLDASASADYEDSDFPAYRLSDGHRGSKWQSTQSGTQKVDLIIPDADVAAAGAFVLDRGFLMTGATLTVKGSANSSFTLSVVTAVTLVNPDPALIHLVVFSSTLTKKYWRIEIASPSVAPLIFNAGIYPIIDLLENPVSPFDPQKKISEQEKFEAGGGSDQLHYWREKREVTASFPRVSDTLYAKLDQMYSDSSGNPVWWFFRPTSLPADGVYGFVESERYFPIVNSMREHDLRIVEA